LTADEEYYDANAGLRFPTPPGYRVFLKAALPPGRLDQPVMLAAYQHMTAKVRTAIEVMAVDLPADQDLGSFLQSHPVGSEKWRAKPPAEAVTVGGRPGVRMTFTYRDTDREHAREVTAVRAGGRAYFIIVVYPPDDLAARAAGRAVIDKIEWLKRD
jgi:hypothetical protein